MSMQTIPEETTSAIQRLIRQPEKDAFLPEFPRLQPREGDEPLTDYIVRYILTDHQSERIAAFLAECDLQVKIVLQHFGGVSGDVSPEEDYIRDLARCERCLEVIEVGRLVAAAPMLATFLETSVVELALCCTHKEGEMTQADGSNASYAITFAEYMFTLLSLLQEEERVSPEEQLRRSALWSRCLREPELILIGLVGFITLDPLLASQQIARMLVEPRFNLVNMHPTPIWEILTLLMIEAKKRNVQKQCISLLHLPVIRYAVSKHVAVDPKLVKFFK